MGSRFFRAGAAAVAAAAMAGACPLACQANPVPVEAGAPMADADRAALGHAAPSPLTGASMPLSGSLQGMGPGDLAQERAEAMATARDPALLPIDMQGVGAQAHPAPSALPKGQVQTTSSDEGLKRFAASARDWMRDVFGKPDDVQGGPSGGTLPGPAGPPDLGLPVETQASGVSAMSQRAARPVEMPPPGAGPQRATAVASSRESAGARLLADSAPEYSIQQFMKRCREVLVHPLTWLAIVLIGVTQIAMSRGRR